MFCLILLCLNGYMYILFTYVCLYIFKFTFMSLRFVLFFVQTFFRDIEDSDSITFGFFSTNTNVLLFHILEVRLHVDFYVFNQYMYIKI